MMGLAVLDRQLSDFDVVSFDVFDTLLLRTSVHPEDVWRTMGEAFYCARLEADRQTYAAATERGGEHTIDEAYVLMGEKWQGWKARELATQRRFLMANPEMLAVWEKAGELGKKRVIVSDMYVGEDWLKETLKGCGIEGWDAFYVSSARQKRKSTGELFKLMKSELGAEGRTLKYLHIGDNAQSDVKRAEENGIVAIRYPKIIDRFFEEFPYVRDFIKMNPSAERSLLVGALSYGWHLYKLEHSDWSYWNKIGYLFGGVLGCAYLEWLDAKVMKSGIKCLLFVARDGFAWEKMYHNINPDIMTKYFYAPRMLMHSSDKSDWVEYENYVRSLGVDIASTAVVDATTINFTAQKIVTKVLKSQVHAYYTIALSPLPANAESMLYSPNRTQRWPNFAEFLFTAPTAPIVSVCGNEPVFADKLPDQERLRVEKFSQVYDGEMYSARMLTNSKVQVGVLDWLDLFDSFAGSMSSHDVDMFDEVRHFEDAELTKSRPLISGADLTQWRWHRKWGLPLVRVRVVRRGLRNFRERKLLGLIRLSDKEFDL